MRKAVIYTVKKNILKRAAKYWGEGSRGLKTSTLSNERRKKRNAISRNGHKNENNVLHTLHVYHYIIPTEILQI